MSLICTSQMNITNTRSTKFKVKAKIKLLISCKLLRTYFFLEKNKQTKNFKQKSVQIFPSLWL